MFTIYVLLGLIDGAGGEVVAAAEERRPGGFGGGKQRKRWLPQYVDFGPPKQELVEMVGQLEEVREARPVLREVLKPFAKRAIPQATKKQLPPLPAIDFNALRSDLDAVRRIVEAYVFFVLDDALDEEEDEDLLLLH